MSYSIAATIFAITLLSSELAAAQTFNSGSTGADGALDLTGTPSGTTVYFKADGATDDPAFPSVEDRLGRALNWSDTRFDFTAITIPAGVTLKLSAQWTNGPVYWLATQAINIAGTVDLSGAHGSDRTRTTANRGPAVPGPGGYPGGMGGNIPLGAAQSGSGPLGGAAAPNARSGARGLGGGSSATNALVPLVGGSGGGGGRTDENGWWGAGGGAGGGAILIASSVSITIPTGGVIAANGGHRGLYNGSCIDNFGGGGGGGSIRLVAPTISGSGRMDANRGDSCGDWAAQVQAAYGRFRVEAFQHLWTFNLSNGNHTTGSPLNSFVPTNPPPSVRVTTVNGVAVRNDPTGAFEFPNPAVPGSGPDVTINASTNVPIVIEAQNLPASAAATLEITLVLFALEGADQTFTNTGLNPTIVSLGSGRYQANVPNFASGFSRGYVRATW